MNDNTLDLRQLLGYFGAVMLAVGVFAPMLSLSLLASLNFFDLGYGDGPLLWLIAATSAYLTFQKRYQVLRWTAGAGVAVCLSTLFRVKSAMSAVEDGAGIFGRLSAWAVRSLTEGIVQLEWGWWILALGIACLAGADLLPDMRSKDSKTVRQDDFSL